MTTSVTVGTGLAENLLEIEGLLVRELDNTSTGADTVSGNAVLTGIVTTYTPGEGGRFVETLLYSHGCLLTKVDDTVGEGATYENVGSLASPSWEKWATQ